MVAAALVAFHKDRRIDNGLLALTLLLSTYIHSLSSYLPPRIIEKLYSIINWSCRLNKIGSIPNSEN